MRLGVRKTEHPAENVTDLVVQPRSRRGEGDRRDIGAVRRQLPAGQPQRLRDDLRQPLAQAADALERQRLVDGVAARRPHRVDAVGDGVEPGGDTGRHRQTEHQARVVDDDAWQDTGIGARRLPAVLGQSPDVGGLGSGVRRGHGEDRQPGRQGDGLGESGGGAAADAHQRVGGVLGGHLTRSFGGRDRHVHRDVAMAHHDREPGQHRLRSRQVGGDRHHPRRAQPAYLLGELLGRAARREADALPGPVVGELHAPCLSLRPP